MTEYDPKKHAKALKDLEVSKARAKRLLEQADAIQKETRKYEALVSGAINARKQDVIVALGSALYQQMQDGLQRGVNLSEWLWDRGIPLSAAEMSLCQADFDKALPSGEV